MSSFITSYFSLDSYPKTCSDCPFLEKQNYRDGAYSGVCYSCVLRYMEHGDTREFDIFHKRWKDCAIEDDKRVNVPNIPFVKKPEKDNQTKIAYFCDRKQCGEACSYPVCERTTEIDHAVRFEKLEDGIYAELDGELTPDTKDHLRRIFDAIGPQATYLQLAEEAAELSQIAAKIARYLQGRNPVSKKYNSAGALLKALTEEVTDVQICLDALEVYPDEKVYERKVKRWENRIKSVVPQDEVKNNE